MPADDALPEMPPVPPLTIEQLREVLAFQERRVISADRKFLAIEAERAAAYAAREAAAVDVAAWVDPNPDPQINMFEGA